MSRVFDALRKSESLVSASASSSDSFFSSLATTHEMSRWTVEHIEVPADSRIVVHSDPHSPGGERFRQLKSYLKELRAETGLKTLLVTSALPHDGKSTIATNIATALAESGKFKVLLLEADLRCPSLAGLFRIKQGLGLADCLQGEAEPMSSIRRLEPLAIYFLSAGTYSPTPLELLHSERYLHLVQNLGALFDWIVIDAPPLVPVADGRAIRKAVDGTILVVRAGETSEEAIEEATRQLDGHTLLGIVLNCAERLEKLYDKYYGYSK